MPPVLRVRKRTLFHPRRRLASPSLALPYMLALLATTTSYAPRSGGFAPMKNVQRFFASLTARKEIDYGALRGRPSLAKEACLLYTSPSPRDRG